jgi:hypothetical protein
MKKLLLLLFSILISLTAYGEWFHMVDDLQGNSYYIESDTIRENGGHVYYWTLADYIDPSTTEGMYSSKMYFQGDCAVGRVKSLTFIAYKKHMGIGSEMVSDSSATNWKYPAPDTAEGMYLEVVCDYIKP